MEKKKKQPAKSIAFSRGNKTRAGLCLSILTLLVLSACGSKPPRWDGSFTGSAEERLEEREGMSEHKTTKDFGIKENITVTVSSEGERDKVVTFGDCKLRFRSDKNPPGNMFQALPGQICKFNFGGYNGDFEMSGFVSLNSDKQSGKDRLGLTLTGYSVEKVRHLERWKMIYHYSFQGERK